MEHTKKHKQPNPQLRYEREIRGWSQSRLAELLGADTSMVSRWECGERNPEHVYQEKLCLLFGKNAGELGLLKRQEAPTSPDLPMQEPEEQTMNRSRRAFFQQSFEFAVGTALVSTYQELFTPEPWERLSMALKKPSSMEAVTLTHLETITKSYWHLRSRVASRGLLNGVLGHLQTVTELLQNPQPAETHRCLCALAGEIAQVAGQMLFDMNDYARARSYYKVSIEAAQEGTHATLYAVALGRMSFLPIYNHQPQQALLLLDRAHDLAARSTSARTAAWLAAIEAEAESNVHHVSACLRALENAENAFGSIASEDDPYWTGFDVSRLAGYRGVCHLRLGQPETARQALQAALAGGPMSIRRRSTILTDLATTHVQLGEVEEGCQLASQALATTVETKSAMVLRRIHDVRRQLEPYREMAVVRELDEQLLLM